MVSDPGRAAFAAVSLTAFSAPGPYLNEANVEELLANADGKAKREVDAELRALAARPQVTPGIRKRSSKSATGRSERSAPGAPSASS